MVPFWYCFLTVLNPFFWDKYFHWRHVAFFLCNFLADTPSTENQSFLPKIGAARHTDPKPYCSASFPHFPISPHPAALLRGNSIHYLAQQMSKKITVLRSLSQTIFTLSTNSDVKNKDPS